MWNDYWIDRERLLLYSCHSIVLDHFCAKSSVVSSEEEVQTARNEVLSRLVILLCILILWGHWMLIFLIHSF